jgi:hypothetical protein
MEYSQIVKRRTIKFAVEFADCPGGRYRQYGQYSGEAFREDFLKPAMDANDEVVVEMDGVIGFPASFLDEAFGILAEQVGAEAIHRKLKIELTDNRVARAQIDDCIRKHLEGKGSVAAK